MIEPLIPVEDVKWATKKAVKQLQEVMNVVGENGGRISVTHEGYRADLDVKIYSENLLKSIRHLTIEYKAGNCVYQEAFVEVYMKKNRSKKVGIISYHRRISETEFEFNCHGNVYPSQLSRLILLDSLEGYFLEYMEMIKKVFFTKVMAVTRAEVLPSPPEMAEEEF